MHVVKNGYNVGKETYPFESKTGNILDGNDEQDTCAHKGVAQVRAGTIQGKSRAVG